MTFPPRWSRFVLAEDGASSVEYGLLVTGIALAILGSVLYMGQVVYNTFFIPAQNLIKQAKAGKSKMDPISFPGFGAPLFNIIADLANLQVGAASSECSLPGTGETPVPSRLSC